MPMKVHFEETAADLRRIGEVLPGRAAQRLVEGAHEIKELSERMTPEDTGALEQSHEIEIEHQQDRVKVTISVGDESAPYALIVHENLTGQAFGDGIRSREKAAREGVVVGPKFLERAFEEKVEEIAEAVAKELRK